jgi:hypothetical protein
LVLAKAGFAGDLAIDRQTKTNFLSLPKKSKVFGLRAFFARHEFMML